MLRRVYCEDFDLDELRFCLDETDVIFERFDEEVVAIQLATGAYYSVTGAGIDAFLMLSAGPTVPELAEALAQKYNADPAAIERDLKPFLEQLRNDSLVVTQLGGARPGNWPSLSHSGPRVPYTAPTSQPFRDLQELFLIDPVHDVGSVGWPQRKDEPEAVAPKEFRYRARSGAAMIFERFDEETLAMNLGTGAYHSLTGPAEDIFLLLAEEPTQGEIMQALRSKYDALDQELSEGTLRFLDSLILTGLAEKVGLESEPKVTRQLSLAKPGAGCAFVTPRVDTFRNHAPPTVLQAPDGLSPLWYARKRFRIPDSGLIYRIAGSEAVVINCDRGLYYRLNSSASIVLKLLEQRPTSSELVEALARLYEIEQHELTAAVLILLHNLSREGLISVEATEGASRRLEIERRDGVQKYEPFSVEAYRDQQHLFLPFPGTNTEKSEGAWSGRSLASLLRGYYQEAADRAGLTEAVYRIAGQNVRVRCAGGLRTAELGLAFNHLAAVSPADDDFTIHAWDCVSGGPSRNSFLAGFLRDFYARWDQSCGPRGEVLPFHSREIPVLYHAGPDILSVIDIENRAGYYLKRDDTPLPYWEIGSPFRTILHFWLSTRSVQFVHGGAVGDCSKGGVILAGKGGVGKSTTALACLNAGMCYAGDDYCAAELKGTPYLHSLYNSAKLKGGSDFERFPHLKDCVWNQQSVGEDGNEKAIFFLSQLWPGRMSAGFPLRALLIPQLTGERNSHLEECSEAQALLALAASTIAQLPMAGAQDLERLGNLVARLRRYVLHLGTDVAQIPVVIQSIL